MIYLSSTTSIPDKHADCFGVMFSAKYTIGGLADSLKSGTAWMMDNNAFARDFDAVKWLEKLLRYRPYRQSCLGIPIPDSVGDCLETLRLFGRYHQIVRDLGYPVAFVSQDGIVPEMTPWSLMDVLFVGGTDDHKLHGEAACMIAEAKTRNKRVHVGRVNSATRVTAFWMCDSVDGTTLTADTGANRARKFENIAAAVRLANARKRGEIDPKGQGVIKCFM
jgi:hypothetical protein